jgi:hypothetical protein
VWIGNVYSNPSLNPNIYPDAEKVVTSGPRPGSGDDSFILQQSYNGIAAMDPDFKWPQMWTTNIAVDQRLPGDILGTLEFIYSKDMNSIYMQNMDVGPAYSSLADGRPFYDGRRINGDAIYVLSNSSKGRSFNITAQLRKVWESGLGLGLSYAYLDATNTLKSTEIASDLWAGMPTPGNSNLPIAAPSEFGQRHRIVATGTYAKRWSDLLRTNFGLFWEVSEGNSFVGAGGNRYSFVYSGDVNGDGATGNDLIYIPRDESEVRLADPSQWEALNAFIEQDSYLSSHRGEIAERFGLINPWYTDLSLRILQDFIFGNGRENVIQLSVDIENMLNLFSSSWGVRKVARSGAINPLACPNPFACEYEDGYPVVNFTGVQETFTDDLSQFSRWRIQFGVRYFMD